MKSGHVQFSWLLAVTLTVVLGCSGKESVRSVAPKGTSIVNGVPVPPSDEISRSTVALYIDLPESEDVVFFCTGTVVSPTRILSAAHCFVDMAAELNISVDEITRHVTIGFGINMAKNMTSEGVRFVPVASVKVHPEYGVNGFDPGVANPDVSVITLQSQVPASAHVVPLLADKAQLAIGTQLTLAGFGATSVVPFPTDATSMNKVDVTVDNVAVNPLQFGYATTEGRSACFGDSGGPAYLRGADGRLYVAGVTSWGDEHCAELGVYTSVPSLATWISEQL